MDLTLKALSDEQLAQYAIEGRDGAFEELYQRYAGRIFKLMYGYVHNEEDARDLTHEVFIRVFKHLHSFDIRKTFSSWIYAIAINCAKNYKYKEFRTNVIVENEEQRVLHEETAKSPEDYVMQQEFLKEFLNAIDGLDSKFKEVFLLRYGQKLHYSDIAEILNISERTAKWRMEKAIIHMVDYLKKRGVL